jgi:hypothetical protein
MTYVAELCNYCKGTGYSYDIHDGRIMCIECHGYGQRAIWHPPKCSECQTTDPSENLIPYKILDGPQRYICRNCERGLELEGNGPA